jgi:uroporphyrin-III C-methyltransferase
VLAHSRREAELIYAGKRAGEESISQVQINNLLIERALEGQVVGRVKGGDPFVFGRGGEEAEALAEACVEWEVIPGVSSGIAAAAYAGIPLTHRGISSSVTFITGHNSADSRSGVDWSLVARGRAHWRSLCALKLSRHSSRVGFGRARSTPIAIVRWGTYEHQEVYSGTLKDLIEAAEIGGFKIEAPALAIVGEVAALGTKLNWFGSSELIELSDKLQFVAADR